MTKLFKYDPKNDYVTITVETYDHVTSFTLLEFCILIDNLFRKYNLPYRIKKKEIKKEKKPKQSLGDFL